MPSTPSPITPPAHNIVRPEPRRNGKSAKVVKLSELNLNAIDLDWTEEGMRIVSRLYRLAFDARTGEEMDAKAAAWLGISTDQARRIRLRAHAR